MPILAGVLEEGARRVLQIARRRTFERREVVFHRGDPADALHLVHSGRFAVRIQAPVGDTVMLAGRPARVAAASLSSSRLQRLTARARGESLRVGRRCL